MKRKGAGLGGFQLELTQEELNSYNISDQGSELKLRAFLFRDGVLYKDGNQIKSINPDDLDQSTKKLVGRGASARVYYVTHRTTHEPLALKEIPITTKTHRDEVAAELAVLAAAIEHPHVIRHFGAFWTAETHCISLVMEWMAYSLADLAKLFGRIDERTTKLIAKQLIAGLQFLHDEKRVIHRDIKPSNVLINSAGEVKFGDFGIAKVIESIRVSTSFVGTQMFMAPERLEAGEYTVVSDVWSLGLTLIACATGKQPWVDDDETAPEGEVNQAIMFKMLQRMHSGAVPKFPETFSAEAHDFATRCLERDPEKRATAKELASHAFIAGQSETESMEELHSLVANVSHLTRRASGGGIGASASESLA
jgi:serine/threonine protein kinase